MADKKDLLIIISETSGRQIDVLPDIKKLFRASKKTYSYKKVKKPSEAAAIAKKEAQNYSVIACYGGDGTVTAVLKSLIDTSATFMLLPGGTANTIAKELQLPDDPLEILKHFKSNKTTTTEFDLAAVNGKPLAFNMHFGLLTDAIKETPRPLKKRFGPLAYGISAIKQLPKVDRFTYKVELKGKIRKINGYGMFVSNRGEQSFLGIKLFPRPHKAGYVQVAVAKHLTPPRLFIWLTGRILRLGNRGGAVKLYRAKELVILNAPKEQYFDDEIIKLKFPLTVKGGQEVVKIIVAK